MGKKSGREQLIARRRGRKSVPQQRQTSTSLKRTGPVKAAEGADEELLLGVLRELKRGNLTVRMPPRQGGKAGKIAAELNAVIAAYQRNAETLAKSTERLARVERAIGAVAQRDLSRTWKNLSDSVNKLAANLTTEIRAGAEVTTAETDGDLTRSIGAQAREEVALLKDKINEMIRKLRETTQRNTAQFAEAQEASRSKSAFLSMAAHELRTPLSVITGYLSMLQDGTLPPERWAGPIEILAAKAGELNKIVNDLLTAARVEAGAIPAQVLRIDLRAAAREAVARARPRATLSRAKLSAELPPEPVLVDADRDQLARVLDNLLNNALTYCTGRPWVLVTVTDADGPRLAVEDHGVGIPVEMCERIFERFFRIDDPQVGPQPGTGLGLYVGRDLAERQGGSLTLERSQMGKGSRFVLRLPPAARRALVHTLVTNSPATLPRGSIMGGHRSPA